jgi:hypothetical protein
MKRKRFNADFKREAVKLATQRELESSGGAGAGAREANCSRRAVTRGASYGPSDLLDSTGPDFVEGKFKAS